ncbi:hypothetical protein CEXT_736721 [Caerostris extrusa]|uniref:Uncharacterized protein n=1 Tax=Caerostris extrusa TaxID=172846 RepID=A0AAV4N2C1_CAEEX|nr:hypothetical protein CEXT_736721 [Caerostris extrusa]
MHLTEEALMKKGPLHSPSATPGNRESAGPSPSAITRGDNSPRNEYPPMPIKHTQCHCGVRPMPNNPYNKKWIRGPFLLNEFINGTVHRLKGRIRYEERPKRI